MEATAAVMNHVLHVLLTQHVYNAKTYHNLSTTAFALVSVQALHIHPSEDAIHVLRAAPIVPSIHVTPALTTISFIIIYAILTAISFHYSITKIQLD